MEILLPKQNLLNQYIRYNRPVQLSTPAIISVYRVPSGRDITRTSSLLNVFMNW